MRVSCIFTPMRFWFILEKERMRVIELSRLNLTWYFAREKRCWVLDQVSHVNSSYCKKMINVTQSAVLMLLSYSMKRNCGRILRRIVAMNERRIFLTSSSYIYFSSLMIKSIWRSLKMSERIFFLLWMKWMMKI